MRMRPSRRRGYRCGNPLGPDGEILTAAGYASRMRWCLPILLLASSALAVTPAHTDVPKIRTGPEPSDIALFVMAAGSVWLVRRFARRHKD